MIYDSKSSLEKSAVAVVVAVSPHPIVSSCTEQFPDLARVQGSVQDSDLMLFSNKGNLKEMRSLNLCKVITPCWSGILEMVRPLPQANVRSQNRIC